MAVPASFEVVEEPISTLADYAQVSISFTVEKVFAIAAGSLVERPTSAPYLKDYDQIEHPSTWPERFDVSQWGVIAARMAGQRIGGTVVACDTPGLAMLEGRQHCAVLWDIRVSPDWRGHGVGAALFRAAESWAVARGCRELYVETQNTNVPACRFYERQGCTLRAIKRGAYANLPHEIQLIWSKPLVNTGGVTR